MSETPPIDYQGGARRRARRCRGPLGPRRRSASLAPGVQGQGAATIQDPETRYRFGPFELDVRARRLDRGDDEIELTPRVFDLLVYFLERPGAAIRREALLDDLWAGVVVGDHSLTEAVSRLRRALGDDPRSPAYIQTIPAYGFRFVAEVELLDDAGAPVDSPPQVWPPLWKLALPGAVLSGLMLAIAIASSFLGAGPRAGEGVGLHEIVLPDGSALADAAAALAPNGRLVALTRATPDRVEVLDLITGDTTPLGTLPRLWNGRHFSWAPDSRTVAFGDRPVPGGPGHLELLDVETRDRRTLLETETMFAALGWSPDGTRLLVLSFPADQVGNELWVVDRDATILSRWPAGPIGGSGRVSPDGRWLALAQWTDDIEGELVVVPLEGVWNEPDSVPPDFFVDWQHGVRISDPPCADDPPYWSPTSDRLLFFTFRSGERALWTVDLVDGAPATQPRPTRVPGDPYVVQGWSADGRIVFCSLRTHSDIAIVEIDPDDAVVVDGPTYLSRWQGQAREPSWSLDPERLLFKSRHEGPPGDLYIARTPSFTRGEAAPREEPERIDVDGRFWNAVWSPDGERVYYGAPSETDDEGQALFEQVLETGTRRQLLPDLRFGFVVEPEIDRSGRYLVFGTRPLRGEAQDPDVVPEGTYVVELQDERLTRIADASGWAAISPDGRWVAVTDELRSEVRLVPRAGGEPRVLVQLDPTDWRIPTPPTFSPDGRTLAYLAALHDTEDMCGRTEMWLVDVEGGPARQVEAIAELDAMSITWSPTSNRLALTAWDCESTVKLYEPGIAE